MAFYRRYGSDARIARIFNTYGPNMRKDDGRAIPNFITHSIEGKPITVYGNGSQTRSFCYITDMVEGLVKLMTIDGLGGEIINLGNPNEVTILETAKLIKKLTGSNSKIVFKPLPQDDPVCRKPDISKAKKILGWKPTTQFEEGLRRTIRYFREVIESDVG
jgi:nucleoside-diphosphate-sugar epimerase